ncbi:MAG: ABC-F family ATP-binding cassette domain-containing protein [Bacteroidales bacterium]
MISVENLTVDFGNFVLFESVSFLVNPTDKIGLTGKNGAGKSTMLKVFAGLQEPTAGKVVVPKDTRIGYLPQHMEIADSRTVFEEARQAYKEVMDVQEQIHEINTQLTDRTDYESDGYMRLITDLTKATDQLKLFGATEMEGEIAKVLKGLGFEETDFERPTSEFSGGWRMRVELAKILLQTPHVLLLDEPTNHLDIEAIEWFEGFLKDFPGAVVLISHDRAFLDNITNRTVEISLGKIYDYNVSYTPYLEQRAERREQQLAAYRNQQKMIKDTEEFIDRFRYKATKAVQVQSRIKQLEKIDRIEVEEEDLAQLSIRFPGAPRSGRVVVETRDLTKRYGDHVVLSHLDVKVERGEKVAFVGKNGEGKTTLSRIIVGELPYENGEMILGHNVDVGYYAQNQDEHLDFSKTVFQTIDDAAVGDIRTKIRDILGAFLFSGEDVDKKVSVLSGGEKARLALAKLLLHPYNLLVLDEPTNHLDMRSKEVLKNALLAFDGTLILVSHDRDFLDGLADKVLEFRDKGIKEHLGGVYEFLRTKRMENFKELEKKKADSADRQANEAPTDNKQAFLAKKEFDKKLRKIERRVTEAESRIEELEETLDKMETKMANPDEATPELFAQYEEQKRVLTKVMEDWEAASFELETAKEHGFS